ncbi:hypothetical protein ABEG18_19135 [Alsobacter sp. KACC 23698]|uniref:Uncharacterized protein n=1 Tax=Alsobacter sp. KACC 23698 TaxID=3149229 RepID=A0AAU7JBS4_9HYPH
MIEPPAWLLWGGRRYGPDIADARYARDVGSAAFPPGTQGPFFVEDRKTWFSVTDASGIRLAAVYHSDPEAGDLTPDEARRIAVGIARLPDWVGRPQ